MSLLKIRAALETALNGMSPSLLTAWENVAFSPPASSVPYQKVNLMLATPDNTEYSSSYQELGYLQVSLFYPLQIGPSEIFSRAELIRDLFKRGATFSYSGVNVNILKTPEVSAGTVDGDRFFVPVKIRFSAFIP